ncbi:MAG TPA: response regulator transcription factor [Acidimicrobiales bacterium]|jgi:YesN/AraC family two-component response regulator|nr:response regulator transcription factor [Acidimicrobiales bacterium]
MANAAGATPLIRVLIVDDEPDMRLLLRSMLGIDQRFEVAGEADNGAEGIELFESLRPDVVILDHRMPVLGGLDAAERILRDHPGQAIVLLSAYIDVALRDDALALGVRQVVGKQELMDLGPHLLQAIG